MPSRAESSSPEAALMNEFHCVAQIRFVLDYLYCMLPLWQCAAVRTNSLEIRDPPHRWRQEPLDWH